MWSKGHGQIKRERRLEDQNKEEISKSNFKFIIVRKTENKSIGGAKSYCIVILLRTEPEDEKNLIMWTEKLVKKEEGF